MKSLSMLSVVALVISGWITSDAQAPQPEVPGDQFSLEGALELFKKSESPEHFEKLLNSQDSKVNNLDLNGDGYIDYIRVFDKYERNVHVFILQAVVSESENQDVAVIELEKKSNGEAVLQIVGDEDIYGITTIIEPTREVRTYAGTNVAPAVVNVWSWPVVQYVYSPRYVVWHSPWGWHHRARWWSPWRPIVYVHYYDYWRPYWSYYRPCHTRRIVYAHHIYHPHRRASVIVYNRHHSQVNRYRSAHRDNPTARYEERRWSASRSADRNRDSEVDRSRSASRDRQMVTPDRSSSRQREISGNTRSTTDIRRDDALRNRTNRTGENRRPVETERSSGREKLLQTPEREQRTPVQRTSQQRTAFETKRPVEDRTNVRQQRMPQVGQRTPSVQRSTPSVQRSAPAMERRSTPSVQRSTPSVQRSTPSVQRRSPSIQRSAPSRNNEGNRSSSRNGSRSRGRD